MTAGSWTGRAGDAQRGELRARRVCGRRGLRRAPGRRRQAPRPGRQQRYRVLGNSRGTAHSTVGTGARSPGVNTETSTDAGRLGEAPDPGEGVGAARRAGDAALRKQARGAEARARRATRCAPGDDQEVRTRAPGWTPPTRRRIPPRGRRHARGRRRVAARSRLSRHGRRVGLDETPSPHPPAGRAHRRTSGARPPRAPRPGPDAAGYQAGDCRPVRSASSTAHERAQSASAPGRRAEDRDRGPHGPTRRTQAPPATAGRIVTSSPSETSVSSPARKRMSSPPT